MAAVKEFTRYWQPPPREMLADLRARPALRWPGATARGLRDPQSIPGAWR
jgi:hypothetical protein